VGLDVSIRSGTESNVAVSKRIIEMYGGKLSIESQPSQGANVENLLDLGVLVRARVEFRRNRELEQGALLGVFGCDALAQCETI
jgi:signal transduction histidine kinase